MDFETRKQQILDWISIPVNRQVLAGLGFGAAVLTFDPVVIAATLAAEGYLVHKGFLVNSLKEVE
jgi:hypothetical protein